MILEYRVKENKVQAAWLKTLYDMVEELNCKCQTYLEEDYDYSYKTFERTRIVEVYGSDTMLNWLKLRMEFEFKTLIFFTNWFYFVVLKGFYFLSFLLCN